MPRQYRVDLDLATIRCSVGVPSACASGPDFSGPEVEWESNRMEQQSPIPESTTAARDLETLQATEILGLHAVDLMTAAAVKLGLYEGTTRDLAEARILINVLAGFIDAAGPELGHHHAGPLRDGLRSLQLAFREYSDVPDAPGTGPGEKYTGPVFPSAQSRSES